jgi:pyrimidine-nucleoside phosphorylase
MTELIPQEIIKTKRRGGAHSEHELTWLVREFTAGRLPEYQMSAWLMAVFFNGLNDAETAVLTREMMNSGRVADFRAFQKRVGRLCVDKHSTGGVGDKTTLILAPIAAAAGVPIPMIAGRALGHTGGTVDKLEAIPGFSVALEFERFQSDVENHGLALIGQTNEICPADKRIYALRDVTATVESLPLICASIMSKKLAEGIGGLVLDVKWGSGAFMKTRDDARALARGLKAIGERSGVRVSALLTDMNQVLGVFAGNSLEVAESHAILARQGFRGRPLQDFARCEDLSVALAGQMICLSGLEPTAEAGARRAREVLESGAALKAFEKLVERQGGRLSEMPQPTESHTVTAPAGGRLRSIDVERLGVALIALGAGRRKAGEPIDPTAGLEMHVEPGDMLQPGQPLLTLHGSPVEGKALGSIADRLSAAHQIVNSGFDISADQILPTHTNPDVISEVVQ